MKVHLEFWYDATMSDGCYWKNDHVPGLLRSDLQDGGMLILMM